jgi:hypothetical protein
MANAPKVEDAAAATAAAAAALVAGDAETLVDAAARAFDIVSRSELRRTLMTQEVLDRCVRALLCFAGALSAFRPRAGKPRAGRTRRPLRRSTPPGSPCTCSTRWRSRRSAKGADEVRLPATRRCSFAAPCRDLTPAPRSAGPRGAPDDRVHRPAHRAGKALLLVARKQRSGRAARGAGSCARARALARRPPANGSDKRRCSSSAPRAIWSTRACRWSTSGARACCIRSARSAPSTAWTRRASLSRPHHRPQRRPRRRAGTRRRPSHDSQLQEQVQQPAPVPADRHCRVAPPARHASPPPSASADAAVLVRHLGTAAAVAPAVRAAWRRRCRPLEMRGLGPLARRLAAE